MRKLSVSTLVTLDGVIQDPGGFGETKQGGWGNPYNGENWISGSLFSFSGVTDITQEGPCGVNCTNLIGRNLYSFHPGIAQATLCDGSVRSFQETINGQVLAFMITREKGEVVPSN